MGFLFHFGRKREVCSHCCSNSQVLWPFIQRERSCLVGFLSPVLLTKDICILHRFENMRFSWMRQYYCVLLSAVVEKRLWMWLLCCTFHFFSKLTQTKHLKRVSIWSPCLQRGKEPYCKSWQNNPKCFVWNMEFQRALFFFFPPNSCLFCVCSRESLPHPPPQANQHGVPRWKPNRGNYVVCLLLFWSYSVQPKPSSQSI